MLLNRVRVSTTTTGTGTLSLGAAESTFQTFASAGAVSGQAYSYLIENGPDWELGSGVWTAGSPDTLTRNVSSSQISGVTGTTLLTLAGTSKVSVVLRTGDVPRVKLLHYMLGATAASFTLTSSVPQVFENLVIKWRMKSTSTSTTSQDSLGLQFNGDTGNHYRFGGGGMYGAASGGNIFGTGTGNTPTSFGGGLFSYGVTPSVAGYGWGHGEITIHNYAQASYPPGVKMFGYGVQGNTGMVWNISVGEWVPASFAAITRIDVLINTNSFVAGGYLDLYGELAGG